MQFSFWTISLCKAFLPSVALPLGHEMCFGVQEFLLTHPLYPICFEAPFAEKSTVFPPAPLLLPFPGKPYVFQQTGCQGLIFRLFVYNADETMFVKESNSLYWNK